jgi:methionyl-tRNA formyltransferase
MNGGTPRPHERMRIAFMGTPIFAARALDAILFAGFDVAAVYTRAPQPSGRGMTLTPTAVGALASERGLPVFTPRSLKNTAAQLAFAALNLDAVAVVAYGLILPAPILCAPRLGCYNLHASLLPRWRGAAPIQRAIMAGDAETGVDVMRMEEGLDTGPILMRARTPIAASDTAQSLHDRLSALGAPLLVEALSAVERGDATQTPQPAEGVLYAEKISSREARIDWTEPGAMIDRRIRALSPFPGAWFEMDGPRGRERVKALMSRNAPGAGAPGALLSADGVLIVACGDGAVELLRVQRAGRSAQNADEFLRGFAPSGASFY